MNEKAISVSQLNHYIKSIFEAESMLHGLSVYGEITDWKLSGDVAYFSLKDDMAALQCVAFGAKSKFPDVKNGDQVVITGSPNYYTKAGRFNFNVYKIEPYGQGLLYLQFLKLKEKLEAEGLFDIHHKKALPKNIKTIGVVSSETGAVIQDIINVTRRRNPNINIVLYPAKVQGEGSAKTIIEGIKFFENYQPVDAIMVARGGGSMEDLSCFNDETLARVVFECTKFLISAVGHETDFTIIDFVSDLRAPTPSAGAELLVLDIVSMKDVYDLYQSKLQKTMHAMLENKTNNLKMLSQSFHHVITNLITETERKFDRLKDKLFFMSSSFVEQKEYDLALSQSKIEKLNPKSILELGYAKVEQNYHNINKLNELDVTQAFELYLQDGNITAKKV